MLVDIYKSDCQSRALTLGIMREKSAMLRIQIYCNRDLDQPYFSFRTTKKTLEIEVIYRLGRTLLPKRHTTFVEYR